MKHSPQPKIASTEFAEDYAVQREKMLRFVIGKGVSRSDAEDVVADAWVKGTETYDSSKGLLPVQWVWWVLQRNIVPQYFRRRNRNAGGANDSPQDLEDLNGLSTVMDLDPGDELRELIQFIRKQLPPPLRAFLDTMLEVIAETESKQIYQEVAGRMNISIEECRNRLKRLRRSSKQLKRRWASGGNRADTTDR